MFNKASKAGFTLVEVLVAVVIVGLVLTAIAAAISFSVKNSSQADYRVVASRYAQEAIDRIRQQRSQLGWNSFYSSLTAGDSCSHISSYTFKSPPCTGLNYVISSNNATFTRKINIVKNPAAGSNPASVQLTVTVEWNDGAATRDVQIVQKLYDY